MIVMKKRILMAVLGALAVACGIQAFASNRSGAVAVHPVHQCVVGNEASLQIRRTGLGSNEPVIGAVIILGCTSLERIGRSEVVGFRTKLQTCVSVDYPGQRESEPLSCAKRGAKNWPLWCRTSPLCPSPVAWTDTKAGVVSRVNGIGNRRVVRVRITSQRPDQDLSVEAKRVPLPERLARVLGLPKRMLVFVSAFADCPNGRLVAEARVDHRKTNVRRTIPNLLPSACEQQATQ